jgi:hypothetical protein
MRGASMRGPGRRQRRCHLSLTEETSRRIGRVPVALETICQRARERVWEKSRRRKKKRISILSQNRRSLSSQGLLYSSSKRIISSEN